MKFMWAVEQMKKGKKVRRHSWENSTFYVIDDFIFLDLDDFEGNDWELYNSELSSKKSKKENKK